MSERWPGGLINQTAPTPANSYNTTKASGVWTLDQAAYLQSQNLWPNPNSDQYFNYNTLLLNGDGTNGAQNNTFLDSSTNNFTITRNGNTTQGSFSPYGNLWSTFFNTSSGNYLTSSATNTSNFGSGNYTMEFWLNTSSATTKQIFYDGRPTGSQSGTQVLIGISNSTGGTLFISNSSGLSANGSIVLTSNTWNHIAFVRSGTGSNQCAIYVNGVLDVNYTDNYTYTTANNTIGAVAYTPQGVNPVLGYMSNMRFGSTAVYTSAFTPSTTPLTAISGTKMLILQSNRFIDNSSNANTFSVTGSPSVQRFSPFNPTAPYSTSVIGGSGYFDGSGAYLTFSPTTATQFGTGDFTIEAWVYPTSAVTNQYIYENRNSGQTSTFILGYGLTGSGTYSRLSWFNGSTVLLTEPTQSTRINAWNHLVYSRSGTTGSLFVNGARVATGTDSTNYSVSSTLAYIGVRYDTTTGLWIGNLTNLRIVKGTAVYDPTQSTCTVPTTPLTAITNTSLLTNFTNAGIPDLAMQNNLQTVGNAQVSTSVVKYGTGSLSFSGSSDKLYIPYNSLYDPGSGDFTLEFWLYNASTSGFQAIYTWGSTGSNANSGQWIYLNGTTLTGSLFNGGSEYSATKTLSTTNTWHHVAFVRSGTTIQIYLDGVGGTSGSFSGAPNTSTAYSLNIANEPNNTTYPFTGYIDDLRITKGLARYTANFTPPTSALPTY